MGGRPPRPFRADVDWGTRITDSMSHYRNEYERKNILTREDMNQEDASFVARHWANEADAWLFELRRWQKLKQAQQAYNQCGRSELDLELENTDVALSEALTKLNDWQEYQFMYQTEVHRSERMYELGQQGIVRTHGAMVVASSADCMLRFEEPQIGWMSYLKVAQDRLKITADGLAWIKSQWPGVIAEACSLAAAAPKLLQQQLEAKFEKQTKAIYRTLQEKGARPSHAVHAPDENASLTQRIQHWVSQTLALDQELWEWRVFMAWRRHIRDSGNMDQQGRRVLSKGDSRSELFQDFVKYQQYEYNKAISWVDCWRYQARNRRGANIQILCLGDCAMDHDDDNKVNEVPGAEEAEKYAVQAKKNVSVAVKRLVESKQKLQDILAESVPPSTSVISPAYSKIQTPSTPPKSPSPVGLQKSRRSSKQMGSEGNRYRRSKKERARRREADLAKTNTKQHALPKPSLNSNNPSEDDEDTQMSDFAEDPSTIEIKENPNQKDSENVVMTNAEDRTDRPPSSPAGSYPGPNPQMDYTNIASSSSQSPISRRTRSATKSGQTTSSKVLKKPGKARPTKKSKVFTDQQRMALLNAAAIEQPIASPTSSEHNPYPTPPTSTRNSQTSSPPGSRLPPSRKSRRAKEIDRVSSQKVHKTSNKNKLRKKAKIFTEEQSQILLHAATASCNSTGPTSPATTIAETYPTPHTSANNDTKPTPHSPSLPSKKGLSATNLDHITSSKSHKDFNQNKPRQKLKNLTKQQAPTLTNTTSASCPSTNPHTPRRSERLKKKAAAGKERA